MRVGNRIQLTTDGLGLYPPVVDSLWRNSIDYAQVVKEYGDPPKEEARRYSPATCKSIDKRVVAGDPEHSKISTSYVERQNLSMRMAMRRFTRLTNGFSKKVENHAHAASLFTCLQLRPSAPDAHEAIRAADHTEQYDLFSRHATATELKAARGRLADRGLVENVEEKTAGRPKVTSFLRCEESESSEESRPDMSLRSLRSQAERTERDRARDRATEAVE